MRWLRVIGLIAVIGSSASFARSNDGLPTGVSFVGLVQDQWQLFVVDGASAPRSVRTVGEPRTPTYAKRLQRAAYISAAGELREIDLRSDNDTVLLKPSPRIAYTQPAYRPGTDELYVVALRDGSSIETDIVRVNRATKQTTTVLQQRSAQFEPAFSADGKQLLYSNVACASECPNVLQEIWAMDVIGGVIEQRTLLNAISRQPTSAGDGTVIFVSNARGSYQLWRSTAIGQAEPLATTKGLAESPIASAGREILFIQRTPLGGKIMRIGSDGNAAPVMLSKEIQDVRDLRWGGN